MILLLLLAQWASTTLAGSGRGAGPVAAGRYVAHGRVADADHPADLFLADAACREMVADRLHHHGRHLPVHRLVVPSMAASLVAVKPFVFGSCQQLKILDPVIERVVVDVVNVLAGHQQAADVLFHYSPIPHDVAVPRPRVIRLADHHVAAMSFQATVPTVMLRPEHARGWADNAADALKRSASDHRSDRGSAHVIAPRQIGLRDSRGSRADLKYVAFGEFASVVALEHGGFTPSGKTSAASILEGFWVSCPEENGEYTERSFEYAINKRVLFEVHLGERDEFALFTNEGASEHIAHTDSRNLLGPAFHYADVMSRTGRNWSLARLGVHLNVIAIPAACEDGYSFAIRLTRDAAPKLARQ